jgi:hypothetical protein
VDDTYTTGQILIAMTRHIDVNRVVVVTLSSGRYSKRLGRIDNLTKYLPRRAFPKAQYKKIYDEKKLTGTQIQQ